MSRQLEAARRDVLMRMHGCAQPNCSACRANVEALEHLIHTARIVPSTLDPMEVVAAVREKQGVGRFWVVRRKAAHKEDRTGGYWEHPGGKWEPGETLEYALRRELREEFGIHEVAIGPQCYENLSVTPNGRYIRVHFFPVKFVGKVELRVHTEAKWMTVPELLTTNFIASGMEFNLWLANEIRNRRWPQGTSGTGTNTGGSR